MATTSASSTTLTAFFSDSTLRPGQHELQVYLQGYKTMSEKMLFRPGQSYKVQAVLQPLAAGDPPDPRPVAAPRPQRYEAPPRGEYAGA